jgi:hypothetical protein
MIVIQTLDYFFGLQTFLDYMSNSPYQQLVVDEELIVDKVVLINKDPYPVTSPS